MANSIGERIQNALNSIPEDRSNAEDLVGAFSINRAALQDDFELVAGRFWSIFASRRGTVNQFDYPTESNPAEIAPLIEVSDGSALLPVGNLLYTAILDRFTHMLCDSPSEQSFLRLRDKTIEKMAESAFRLLFGDQANYYVNAYETPEAQKEHDLVIEWKNDVLVVEAKATPDVPKVRATMPGSTAPTPTAWAA